MKVVKKLILSIGFLVGVSVSGSVFAQGWCWGWGPECISSTSQDTGGSIDETSSYTPPTVIILPDSWGALAQSTTTKAMGVASKQASKQASKRLALQNCASNGASDCKVLMTYKNTCVAIAQNAATASYGHNPNISILREQLLKGCSDSSNGERCKIVYEECMP